MRAPYATGTPLALHEHRASNLRAIVSWHTTCYVAAYVPFTLGIHSASLTF